MRVLSGVLLGAVLSTSLLAGVFITTTISYRSTLFQIDRVTVKSKVKLYHPTQPFSVPSALAKLVRS
jgi:hypothetical protein